MKTFRTTLLTSTVAFGLIFVSLTASAQIPPPESPDDMLSNAFTGESYSPYAGRSFPTFALWGDKHLHPMLSVALAFPAASFAQGLSPGSTMDVFIFPAEGLDAGQQSKEQAAYYEWAVGNTGSDPFELARQKQADEQQAQQRAAEQAEQREGASEHQLANFKNACSVCARQKSTWSSTSGRY